MKVLRFACLLALLTTFGCTSEKKKKEETAEADKYSGPKFNDHIRSTASRTPEEERLGFKLPEGFEVTLYASEPDIGKPINIAFDAKGRVWVTQSFEYPFPATPGKGRDRLTILEDTNSDGTADKFTHFDDTLNIPIGIMPVTDGAVTYSIPNIYKYTDTDGDGKPDTQKKLIGPFEHRDTHGMVNNFVIGYDGWIYACHGFTNRSNVAGADGDTIHMISGNTFRFRRDGSRVEHTTDGRINPFGLVYDEKGYLYSTDCHTSPLYQLIRGGDYTQWGKEEEMGFAPDMKPLENEATALAGIAYYADTKYPDAYRSNFYIGDVVSSRIYRNSFVFKGSSPVGKREEDFMLSEDPWFRPVDVKLGPDGALYIADFYNSIIGHYEVPLDHPKRDKIRGRIWRVTYKGNNNKLNDWSTATVDKLIAALDADNQPVRMMAADQLADRIGKAAAGPALELLNKKGTSSRAYILALWTLHRIGELPADLIKKSAADKDPLIRLHTMRILLEQKDTNKIMYPVVMNGLEDNDPHVKRAAVELMEQYPGLDAIKTLIEVRKKTPEFDSHLIYTIRLKLRNLLRSGSLMKQVASLDWKNDDAAVLATVMPGVQLPESGTFLYNYVKAQTLSDKELPKAFMHIIRFIPAAQLDQATITAREKSGNNLTVEYQTFRAMQQGLDRKGLKENSILKEWGKRLAGELVARKKDLMTTTLREPDTLQKMIDAAVYGTELAGKYKVTGLEPQLIESLNDTTDSHFSIRGAALKALIQINPKKNLELAQTIFDDKTTANNFRKRMLEVMGEFPGPDVNRIMGQIKNAPPDLQQVIVMSLAGSAEGKQIIFEKVKKGEIFARTLVQPKIEERIMINITPKQKAEFTSLTANLEDINKEKQALINTRIRDFNELKTPASAATGRTIFVRTCTPCHSIGGEGGSIGPQLDGVGKWGVTSLSEKILDPNRNISETFRNYTVKTKDGKVMSGLYRRDEGEVSVFADVTGKEFTVSKKDIQEKTASKFTLMPDQFANILSPEDFNALIAYLLTVKSGD